jgi:hypothetical protein
MTKIKAVPRRQWTIAHIGHAAENVNGGPSQGSAIMASNTAAPQVRRHATFAEFYPYFLTEHSGRANRRMHFAGLALALMFGAIAVATWRWPWILAAVASGYGFAFAGHFIFEKNVPYSVKQPLYGVLADFRMCFEMVIGRIPF